MSWNLSSNEVVDKKYHLFSVVKYHYKSELFSGIVCFKCPRDFRSIANPKRSFIFFAFLHHFQFYKRNSKSVNLILSIQLCVVRLYQCLVVNDIYQQAEFPTVTVLIVLERSWLIVLFLRLQFIFVIQYHCCCK